MNPLIWLVLLPGFYLILGKWQQRKLLPARPPGTSEYGWDDGIRDDYAKTMTLFNVDTPVDELRGINLFDQVEATGPITEKVPHYPEFFGDRSNHYRAVSAPPTFQPPRWNTSFSKSDLI